MSAPSAPASHATAKPAELANSILACDVRSRVEVEKLHERLRRALPGLRDILKGGAGTAVAPEGLTLLIAQCSSDERGTNALAIIFLLGAHIKPGHDSGNTSGNTSGMSDLYDAIDPLTYFHTAVQF